MQTIFRGGLPYSHEVGLLVAAFPVPDLSEGRVIKHEEIEAVTKLKRGTGRYYGVVKSWINSQRNQNGVVIEWEPSIGIRVLDPAGVLQCAEKKTSQKIRQVGRAVRRFGWVDRSRLDDTGQRRLDHQVRVAAVVSGALAAAKKDLAIDLAPVQSLPKRIGGAV